MRPRPPRRYRPPSAPAITGLPGGRPPTSCRKPPYEELERRIAALDREMAQEGPIENLYDIFRRKMIENVAYGTGWMLGSDQRSVDIAERWVREVSDKVDIDNKIMLSFMLGGYLGANLMELDGARWEAGPDGSESQKILRFPDANGFDIFDFTLSWIKDPTWSLAGEYGELRKGVIERAQNRESAEPRARNIEFARSFDLEVSAALPRRSMAEARPVMEVALRAVALQGLIGYVTAPAEVLSTASIQAIVQQQRLGAWLTADERAVFQVPRGRVQEHHASTIGWSIETLATLCWSLGADLALGADIAPLGGEDCLRVVRTHAPDLAGDVRQWLQSATLRAQAELVAMEDMYYCLHNGVRNAVLGRRAGLAQERAKVIEVRRHALTWILSPGVVWSDTDVST